MDYVVVAFRSRAHTVKFAESLRMSGVAVEIINTPKEAGVGCGLSVKTSKTNLALVKKSVRYSGLDSFAGTFLVRNFSGKRVVRTI